jgi:hypothetical protein
VGVPTTPHCPPVGLFRGSNFWCIKATMDEPTLSSPQAAPAKRTPKSPSTPVLPPDPDKPVTVLVPESLLRRAKVLSAVTGESLSDLVVAGLRTRVRKDLRAALATLADQE